LHNLMCIVLGDPMKTGTPFLVVIQKMDQQPFFGHHSIMPLSLRKILLYVVK